jgi:hypothetical protein
MSGITDRVSVVVSTAKQEQVRWATGSPRAWMLTMGWVKGVMPV